MSAPGKKAPSAIARWRERRRAKHQAALEREFHQQDRLDPTTAAYTSADNHARRWTSLLGSGGGGIG
jgi:hypothetical protein